MLNNDLEIWARSHSDLFEMAPFNRSHTSSYRRSIVTMTIFPT